jgi:hypothetical protein
MVGPCNSAQEGKGEDHGEQGGNRRETRKRAKRNRKRKARLFRGLQGHLMLLMMPPWRSARSPVWRERISLAQLA